MSVSTRDRDVLRELGNQVAEIAALPVQQETIANWKALNGLKPVRPMVMVDNIPWHEMDVDGELALQTSDTFSQRIETKLRKTLYAWKHMRADMVVDPVIDIPKVTRGVNLADKESAREVLGMEIEEDTVAIDADNEVVAHHYFDQLQTEDDIEKIAAKKITHDEEATARDVEKATDIFDGIMAVQAQGYMPRYAPWDDMVTWRGAQNALLDLADRPDFVHRIMDRIIDAYLSFLDQLEEQGLLGYATTSSGFAQRVVACTGAYTDELPTEGSDPQRPRAEDSWTYGMAQIFSEVSPAMHKEFELDYATKWYSRFGLAYYGCCDPLHTKMDLIRTIPNLRKISMSPWVDVEQGAEQIAGDFVFSRKPNPVVFITDNGEAEIIENDIRETIEVCARYGCPVEIIMKDISTVQYKPQRLWEWVDVAMRIVRDGG
jgi:hypothetical protein